MESIKTAMSTAFSTVQTNVVDMISTCAPYALAVIGVTLAVGVGIKVFKRLTGQAQHVRKICYHGKGVGEWSHAPFAFVEKRKGNP